MTNDHPRRSKSLHTGKFSPRHAPIRSFIKLNNQLSVCLPLVWLSGGAEQNFKNAWQDEKKKKKKTKEEEEERLHIKYPQISFLFFFLFSFLAPTTLSSNWCVWNRCLLPNLVNWPSWLSGSNPFFLSASVKMKHFQFTPPRLLPERSVGFLQPPQL